MNLKTLLPFLVLMIVALGCGGSAARQESQTIPTPTPDHKLMAEVSLGTRGITVRNIDTMDFPSVDLTLNIKQLGSNDGEGSSGRIAKGESVVIPYSEFTVGTTRFDFSKTKILTVYLDSSVGKKLFLCPGVKCQPAN